jgi:hypothetical protein
MPQITAFPAIRQGLRACAAVAEPQNQAVDFGRANPLFCKVIDDDFIQAATHGREL